MDCSPPGSSVHGISQARILKWVAISTSKRFSQPREQTRFLLFLHWHFAGRKCFLHFLYHCVTCKAQILSQFSAITQSCPTPCNPMDCSTSGFLILHCLPEFTQTHVHQVGDAIQPSHPLLPPSPPALNLFQHQGPFQWIGSSHQVTKVLELKHQSFQWIFRFDFR